MELNGILDFNPETGLIPHSKAEILDDLKNISKQAFGSDFSIQEGTEWYTFLDVLATSLSSASGSAQKLYSTLGIINASGTILDSSVSLAGITRKGEIRSRVRIRMSVQKGESLSYQIPSGTIIKCVDNTDSSNVSYWKSNETIYLEQLVDEKYLKGYGTFYAYDNSDNYTIVPFENGHFEFVDSVLENTITFEKDSSGKEDYTNYTGYPQETDAELRYRYVEELYKPSTGTVEGLQAALLNLSDVKYAKTIQNSDYDQAQDPYHLPKHSVWVIVDGHSSWNPEEFTVENNSFTDGTKVFTFNSSYTIVTVDEKEYTISNNQFYVDSILYELSSDHKKVTKNPYSTDTKDIEIAKVIYDRKSIGCSTAIGYVDEPSETKDGQGPIVVKIEENGIVNTIRFSRASELNTFVEGNIVVSGLNEEEAKELAKGIISEAKNNIQNYINNLGIGNDILYGGLVNSIYQVHIDNAYKDYVFDVETLQVNKQGSTPSNRVVVDPNEYAIIQQENIILTATYNGKQLIFDGGV